MKKKIKARITWANPDRLHCPLTALSSVYEPHFVLPATHEAYWAMVKRMACVIHGARLGMKDPQKSRHFCGNDATCAEEALSSIGITPPRKGRGK